MRSRYASRGPLGHGAMGSVDRVYDSTLRREVARKRLGLVTPAAVVRFKREFRAVEGLSHPNLVRVHELDEDERGLFFTMELVEGVDLATHCAASDRIGRVRAVLPELVSALRYLHDAGIVHRDLKPANVLVKEDGSVKLVDFGVLLQVDDDDRREMRVVAGTPGNMAPEQIRGEPITSAADLYALGALLFELVTGRSVFEGTPADKNRAHLELTPPRLLDVAPDAPALLDELVAALLAKSPGARPSLAEIAALLRAPSLHVAQRRPLELVGRDDTLHAIFALLQPGSAARLVVLTGPTGSGKPAHLDVVGRGPSRAGGIVLRGAARPTERVAFNALDGIMDMMAESPLLVGAPPDALALAASAFPVLGGADRGMLIAREVVRARMFGRAVEELLPPRRAIFAAIARLLGHAGGEGGALLSIDDAQWADHDSLALLTHLFDEGPVALRAIVALRDDVGPHPAAEWLAGRRDVVCVAVPPLGNEATRTIIDRMARAAGGAPGAADLDRAVSACAGRPFLAEVAGRALAAGRESAAGGALDPSLGDLSAVDRGLVAILLAADEWTALTTMAALTERPLGEVDDGVRRLAERGIVRRGGSGDATGSADLYHQGVREVAARVLSERDQSEAHRLLAQRGEASGASPDRIVRHLIGAGLVDRAAVLARSAARLAEQHRAFGLAAEMYGVALTRPADDADELTEARARALERSGRYREAATLWAGLSVRSRGERRADHLIHEAHALIAASDVSRGLARLDELVRASGTVVGAGGIGTAALAGARLVFGALRPRPRPRPAATAQGSATRAERNVKVGVLLSFLDPLTGLAFLQHAQRELERVGRDEQAAACDYLFAILAMVASRKPNETFLADRYRRAAAARLGGRASRPEVRGMASFVEGLAALRRGEWDSAAERLGAAVTIFSESDGTTERMMASSFAMMADVYRQDLGAMRRHLAWFRRNVAESGGLVITAHVELLAGYIELLGGHFTGARLAIQRIVDMFDERRPNAQRGAALLYRHMSGIYGEGDPAPHVLFARDAAIAAPYRFFGTMYAGPLAMIGALLEANALRTHQRRASLRRLERFAGLVDSSPPFAAGASWRARAYAADARGEPALALAHLVRAEQDACRFGRSIDVAIARYQQGRRLGGDGGKALIRDAESAIAGLGASTAILAEDAGLR